jgi:hypothetical protein
VTDNVTGRKAFTKWMGAFLIFEREALSDFIDPLFELIESGMHGPVVQVKNIPERGERENPVMAFDIAEHILDRVTDKSERVQQNVHRVLRKMSIPDSKRPAR